LLNPGAYKHLQEEIDSAFTGGEEPLDSVKLSHMEWLNGCMWVTVHLKNLRIFDKLLFTVPTAMRPFVFNLLSQVVPNAR
jgi:hypothetical protein